MDILVWTPEEKFIATTNIAKCMKNLNIQTYDEFYQWSITHYEEFLEFIIKKLNIKFDKYFNKIMDLSHSVESPRWFSHAKMNIINSCFNASPDTLAIIYKNHQGITEKITYSQLEKSVNQFSNSLLNYLKPGDAVAIVMQMRPETIISYLGIIKAGCTVVSIPDSFSASEIQKRLEIGNVKIVLTHDQITWRNGKYDIYKKVVEAGAPLTIVVPYEKESINMRNTDKLWHDFLEANDQFKAISCHPGDYTNILFSSGTTGLPKGIPWTHTTPIKCAMDAYFHQNIQIGDILAWPTNLGWMMGPWLLYAGFINQATVAICEGSPTDRFFGEFIQDNKVTMLGLVPSIVKAWRNSHCMEGLDFSSIKLFSSSGEPSYPEDMSYLMTLAGHKPIIEYCGGTEIGGAYITNTLLKPQMLSRFNTPALGSAFMIIDHEGKPALNGEVALIPPAIGLSTTLLNKNHHETYFENMPLSSEGKLLRRHGDELSVDNQGFYRMMGRSDDTMKLNGIKVSSIEIENTLINLEGIVETAAIAITPTSGGPSQLIIFAVKKENTAINLEDLKKQMQKRINELLNPFFKIHEVILIDKLPRTDSNKIQRRKLRDKIL